MTQKTDKNRTTFHNDAGEHVATMILQSKDCVWWCTANGGGHAGSAVQATLRINESL